MRAVSQRGARARRAAVALAAGAWAAALPVAAADAEEGPSPPDLVLLVIDTLRADRLGSYGLPLASSPEIDAFAASGVRFETVIAPSSWTRPSIGALLAASHPRELGLYRERGDSLREDVVTLAEALRARGYATFGATANPHLNRVFGFDQGFDRYLDSTGEWWFLPGHSRKQEREGPAIQTARELFDAALTWARSAPPAPRFVQLDVMEVHEAFEPWLRVQLDASAFGSRPDAAYLAAIRRVSAELGRFATELSALGWNDVVLAITSDHGEGLDDHPGIRGGSSHGLLLYESQVRVPLVLHASADRLPRGRVVKTPVRLLDVMPTLLDLAGAAPPSGIEGVSLRPLWEGGGRAPGLPPHFVVETRFRNAEKIGIYTKEWRYLENLDAWQGLPERELQRAGGRERGTRSDAGDAHPALRRELAQALAAWRARHPAAPPAPPRQLPTRTELEQLRALGYVVRALGYGKSEAPAQEDGAAPDGSP